MMYRNNVIKSRFEHITATKEINDKLVHLKLFLMFGAWKVCHDQVSRLIQIMFENWNKNKVSQQLF